MHVYVYVYVYVYVDTFTCTSMLWFHLFLLNLFVVVCKRGTTDAFVVYVILNLYL